MLKNNLMVTRIKEMNLFLSFTFLVAKILCFSFSTNSGPAVAQIWEKTSALSGFRWTASSCCCREAGFTLWYTAYRGQEIWGRVITVQWKLPLTTLQAHSLTALFLFTFNAQHCYYQLTHKATVTPAGEMGWQCDPHWQAQYVTTDSCSYYQ